MPGDTEAAPSNFIRSIVEDDLRSGRHRQVVTRFPPEPNGYLHIGHAKAICLDFGLAAEFGGRCHLRFDDTNPTAEKVEYAEAIQRDVRWLGFDWGEHLHHASDYFEQLYTWAQGLIGDGLAYVCELDEAAIRATRGTVTEPGTPSPWRDRPAHESLELFDRMRRGEFPEGTLTLRAKINMASPNMKMRDPVLYRILRVPHHRIGAGWNVYPMYDWAHCLSDALEGITHSLCTLEFDNNRELYDWIIEHVPVPSRPRQYEFAKLLLGYTLMGKRKLRRLVEEGHVTAWDDPRMPTLAGLRRRGIRPDAIRDLCERVGVAKANSLVDLDKLDFSIRNDLNPIAPRVMCVLDPLRVVVTNWPEGHVEELDASYWPHDVPREGTRKVPFTRELYIERDDFREQPPRKFFRLAPGREVRLRYGYFIRCDSVVKDAGGNVIELRCTYDPATRGGQSPDGRKVKGTLHWVSASHSVGCEVRQVDRLFVVEEPDASDDVVAVMNPRSMDVLREARIEPSVLGDPVEQRYQFERQGYYWRDPVDGRGDRLVFNRIVALKSGWAKTQARTEAPRVAPEQEPTSVSVAPREFVPRNATEASRYGRYVRGLGLAEDVAAILAGDAELAGSYEQGLATGADPKGLANWAVNELQAERKGRTLGELPFGGAELGELVKLVDEGTLSGRLAKELFAELAAHGGDPRAIVEAKGWRQVSDPAALRPVIEQVLAAHPGTVEAYRGGRAGLRGFFVGQVIRETQGKANPVLVDRMVGEALEGRFIDNRRENQ